MATINIINAAALELHDLEHVSSAVQHAFRLHVAVKNAPLDVERAFDISRRQYHSTALLSHILAMNARHDDKVVAIVNVDLFVPILTFVFGEAQFQGPAAIVSTTRLANQFYGIEADTILLRTRLEKEIVHELGHTFGLYHCHYFDCVMRSSTYVEEIDLKRIEFCTACTDRLHQNVAA